MRTPTQAAALGAIGASDDELAQALALLRVAGQPAPEDLTLGEGDRLLLELHRALTGGDAEVELRCPACETLNVATLSPQTVPAAVPRCAWLGPGGGLRQPTYGDLLGLPADPEQAEAELLARCVVGAPSRPVLAEAFEIADDALSGPICIACVECGQPLQAPVDVQRLVLEGLQRCALTLDYELHVLASAYGWSLREIESLPDARRRHLVSLVAEGR